ncbi:diguanylate cyclase [Rhizobium sp. TRM95111]|uniref:diguanylate cyclase domain-containing protein n=1 Tax=Rhizobium alarense TaxID=2846851 RepID=UPI001F1C3DA3|nr:diguanylate cyclase [Rhizobium alarense]MCF3641785.1 diguanylate cyclase [Rhizobium alarense]
MLGPEIRAFLEACPLAALVADASGMVVFANSGAQAIFECAVGDILGRAVTKLLPEWPASTDDVVRIAGAGNRLYRVLPMRWQGTDGPATAILIEPAQRARDEELAEQEANRRLRYVIEMLPQAVCVFDAMDRYVLWNQKYAELYDDIAADLRPGIGFEDILRLSLASGRMPEVVDEGEIWLRERMRKFRQPSSREEQQLRDGRWLRHDDRRTPDGGAIGMRIDITELKQREEWLAQLFDANPMPMLLCDGDSLAILQANRAAIDFYGCGTDGLPSKHAFDMHAEDQAQTFAATLRALHSDCEGRTVWRQTTADGSERHVLIYVRLLREGGKRRLLLTVADVSDRVLAEREATRLAHHDVLTGLPNRIQFYKSLEDALRHGGEAGVLVYCLDLDGFKPVNDTFGHAAGDEVLRMVAERLLEVAHGHLVARLGGDEFAILAAGDGTTGDELAARCVSAFEPAFTVRGLPIRLGVSIGIAAAPRDGVDGEAIVQAADRALYRAKAAGRNGWCRACDPEDAPRRAEAG